MLLFLGSFDRNKSVIIYQQLSSNIKSVILQTFITFVIWFEMFTNLFKFVELEETHLKCILVIKSLSQIFAKGLLKELFLIGSGVKDLRSRANVVISRQSVSQYIYPSACGSDLALIRAKWRQLNSHQRRLFAPSAGRKRQPSEVESINLSPAGWRRNFGSARLIHLTHSDIWCSCGAALIKIINPALSLRSLSLKLLLCRADCGRKANYAPARPDEMIILIMPVLPKKNSVKLPLSGFD